MQHVEHWLEHDVWCSTLCTNRISHAHFQLEPSWVVIRLGQFVLEASSTTQGVISLSNGEAESYATTRAAPCGIQLQQFFTDIGCPLPLRVQGASARARGMMTRRGSGRVKHLDIKALWCQEAIEKVRFRLMKADSENNPADIGTKTPSADRIVHFPRLLGLDAS